MTPHTPDDTPHTQRRFLRGETGPEETAALVRAALLAGGDPQPWSPPTVDEESYAAALDGARAAIADLSAQTREEEAAVGDLLAELRGMPAAAREAAVRQDRRFATWGVGDALRAASLAACTSDPDRAVELARLAAAAADGEAASDARDAGSAERGRADLAALAHGQLANALRVASELRDSEQSLDRAFDLAAAGSGDPLIRARLLSLGASLRSDQSRFEEAGILVRRAARVYLRLGDDHAYGRTLLKQASLEAYQERLEEACGTLLRALQHLDARAEPRLTAVAHNNFASYLERLGQPAAADRELDAVEELLERFEGGDDTLALDRGRLAWMRGRVAVRLGDQQRGEVLFNEARRIFGERRVAYDSAQVALELALIYADAGRVADQRRLAEEMLPIFTSRDLHAEARAALRLYTDAARSEAVGQGLIRQLSVYLDRARSRPGLRFDPS